MVNFSSADIRIIPATDLDPAKWDGCALSAADGTLFAGYDYLNQMAPCWSGLVLGDYRAVLPLIYKRKMGIKYLCGLPFVKQLGLIGRWRQSDGTAVFDTIHHFVKFGDICFNQNNAVLMEQKNWARPNYELDLTPAYDALYNGFHKTLRKRLTQINQQQNLRLVPADAKEVARRYQIFLQEKTSLNLGEDFKRLAILLNSSFGAAYFTAYKVIGPEREGLLFGLLGKDAGRIYNFMTAVTPKGRKLNASSFALDQIIRQHAGTGKVLDFMGSALPGVRTFIESFAAINNPYYLYHFNHLPWPLHLFKK